MNTLVLDKMVRVIRRKTGALVGGSLFSVEKTLAAMALRPFELHLELTNLCNANCIFCPYQFQERPTGFMSDQVFEKAVNDYVKINGGSVGLTPIVGDALIDPKFLERVRHLRSLTEIDRIFLTTNAILLDKHGITEVLTSGLTSVMISTSGFEKESYKRIYRSPAYERMKENVTYLVEENTRLGSPVHISICLRTDRPLAEVMRDPDFQPILKHNPSVDFAWSYRSVGGRITRETLPDANAVQESSTEERDLRKPLQRCHGLGRWNSRRLCLHRRHGCRPRPPHRQCDGKRPPRNLQERGNPPVARAVPQFGRAESHVLEL